MLVKSREKVENIVIDQRSIDADKKSAKLKVNTSQTEKNLKKTSRNKSDGVLEAGYLKLSKTMLTGVLQEGRTRGFLVGPTNSNMSSSYFSEVHKQVNTWIS